MNTLFWPLEELDAYRDVKERMEKNQYPAEIYGCMDSGKTYLMAALGGKGPYVIVTYDEIRAKAICEELKTYYHEDRIFYYPAKDMIFYRADLHGNAIVRERLRTLSALLDQKDVIVVTTIDGGMNQSLPFSVYEKNKIKIHTGDTLLEDFVEKLVELGYCHVGQVSEAGEFSRRGDLIDVFPLTEENPYRIELWGDDVDNIRMIDVETQRSIEPVEEIYVTPALEIILTESEKAAGMHAIRKELAEEVKALEAGKHYKYAKKLTEQVEEFLEYLTINPQMVNVESYLPFFIKKRQSFFDYIKSLKIPVFVDEKARCKRRAETVEYEFLDSMKNRLEMGQVLPGQMDVLYGSQGVFAKLETLPCIYFHTLKSTEDSLPSYEIPTVQAPSYNKNFMELEKDLKKYSKRGYRVLVLSGSLTRARRLFTHLDDAGIHTVYKSAWDVRLKPGEILISKGQLGRGFELPSLKWVVIGETDLFGRTRKKRRRKSQYDGERIRSFSELKIGDYVVHENHGLGIYQGLEKIEQNHVIKDYLKVSYAEGGNLYIPATSVELLQKYASADGEKTPKLNKLHSGEWKKTKGKVKKAVEDIARELVALYAKRQSGTGHAFEPDTVWQKEFEELFPYEETEDQVTAIEDTKRDMESSRIMDRLICGDVGFGKTEVAIRAAFKAVMDSKQVAMLVPTTILASQHYTTFKERMRDFGVEVELLCRLRTPAEQRVIMGKVRKGSVDILIGTHKILNKVLEFKDLGLLIIDEEQRFGVKQKEKLKELNTRVDVLTLSATPIPRTLHMSLVGIRDMSLLEEPPMDRMPIQTFVMESDQEMVREAIVREIARGGQVYFVHNRVADIDRVAAEVQAMVPEITVRYAHGQMGEKELEDVMFSFIQGDTQVLVSTTIVEAGLDIPNVNTIIINDAERFGLSQLYQLRGRVGRSNRVAYAFLFYRRDKILKEEAEKRLTAIKEFTDLGSGVKISMRDLEIRGAGNLLGAKQHGHMEAVGYDLYCKMLNHEIKRLKGTSDVEGEFETTIDLRVDGYIPVEYIPNEIQKLEFYKRIAEIETPEEQEDMLEELQDRFGTPPRELKTLLEVSVMKAEAHKLYISEVKQVRNEVEIWFTKDAPILVDRIAGLLQSYHPLIVFRPMPQSHFAYQLTGAPIEEQVKNLIPVFSSIIEKGKNQEGIK